MAGTKKGGIAAATQNKVRHGRDFYKRIGAMGGSKSSGGGFAYGEEGRKRASYYGRLGGKLGSTKRKFSESYKKRVREDYESKQSFS